MEIASRMARAGISLAISSALLLPASKIYAEVITVQSGDSLYKIAQRTNTSVSQIKEFNGLTSDRIFVGQKLNIPESIIHAVVKGDTIWKLSQAYKVNASDIISANKLSTTQITIGQKLIIPLITINNDKPTQTEKNNDISYIEYSVRKGDTAWSIAIAHGIPMPELLKANYLTEKSALTPGQILKVPVHSIPVTTTPGPQYGEYLDWFKAAQYLFPINKVATVTDFASGKQFKVKRVLGAFHSDTEPLTYEDAAQIKRIWGGNYSWKTRAVIVTVDNRRIAASMTSMPHGEDFMSNNNFNGHFDIHFKNSLRHVDGKLDLLHQAEVEKAAGLKQ